MRGIDSVTQECSQDDFILVATPPPIHGGALLRSFHHYCTLNWATRP